MVYLIVGRAKAGKTTRAYQLAWKLTQRGKTVFILDGDQVRELFPTGYSDEDRLAHITRIAKIAKLAEAQGLTVIVAIVAPKKIWRQLARVYWQKSELIYVESGEMWEGTEYEEPDEEEFNPSTAYMSKGK